MVLSTMVANWLTVGVVVLLIRIAITATGTLVFYVHQHEQATPKTLKGFIRFCLPGELWTHHGVRMDAIIVALRKLTGFAGVVPAATMIAAISPRIHGGLEAVFGAHATHPATLAVSFGVMLVVLLVRDFCDFYLHYLAHRWQWLWEFHAMHHSATFLTPLSGKRSHFVEDLIHIGVIGTLLAITVGVCAYIAGFPPAEISMFGVDAYLVGHLLDFNELQHSHVALSFGRLERYFISPAQHHLHHDRTDTSRNLGSLLSVWDRMFGTFAYSQKPDSFAIGLAPDVQPDYDSVVKMHLRPFQNCWNHMIRAMARRASSKQHPVMAVRALLSHEA